MNQQPGSDPLTFKLRNGREVFAERVTGENRPVTYGNRALAKARVDKLGTGWEVVRGLGRPFYAGKILPQAGA